MDSNNSPFVGVSDRWSFWICARRIRWWLPEIGANDHTRNAPDAQFVGEPGPHGAKEGRPPQPHVKDAGNTKPNEPRSRGVGSPLVQMLRSVSSPWRIYCHDCRIGIGFVTWELGRGIFPHNIRRGKGGRRGLPPPCSTDSLLKIPSTVVLLDGLEIRKKTISAAAFWNVSDALAPETYCLSIQKRNNYNICSISTTSVSRIVLCLRGADFFAFAYQRTTHS